MARSVETALAFLERLKGPLQELTRKTGEGVEPEATFPVDRTAGSSAGFTWISSRGRAR
jgi:hypothetical protein